MLDGKLTELLDNIIKMWLEKSEIETVLQKVIDLFLVPRFHELQMDTTGEWLESLEVQSGDDSGVIRGRNYSEQLAKGREPGKLPPISAIERWVNAKLGYSGKEGNSIAWAISKKIQKEGTSWYKKGGSDLLEVLEEPKVIQFIQDEFGGIVRLRIADNLVRNAQNILA